MFFFDIVLSSIVFCKFVELDRLLVLLVSVEFLGEWMSEMKCHNYSS